MSRSNKPELGWE